MDGSLQVWNLQSGITNHCRDGGYAVSTILLSPDGAKVVSGSMDGVVRLWDVGTGKLIARVDVVQE